MAHGRLSLDADALEVRILRRELRNSSVCYGGEPRLDAAEQFAELAGLAPRQLGKSVLDGCLGDAPDALVQALCFGGQVDAVDAAVAGLRATLDPALGLQSVESAGQRLPFPPPSCRRARIATPLGVGAGGSTPTTGRA